MAINVRKITPCLWFNSQAEEAARFYTSIFRNSRMGRISRYGKEGYELHGQPEGMVMTVEFELEGHAFTALNAGPAFTFNEAVSFQVRCDSQEEADYYWDRLSEGGDTAAQQCGWLKDRYGLSWQIFPEATLDLVSDPGSEKSQRAFRAMLGMKKIDLAALKRAYDGEGTSH